MYNLSMVFIGQFESLLSISGSGSSHPATQPNVDKRKRGGDKNGATARTEHPPKKRKTNGHAGSKFQASNFTGKFTMMYNQWFFTGQCENLLSFSVKDLTYGGSTTDSNYKI